MEQAILGGGCFWCVEGAYKRMKGIESALPGYAGGQRPNPTYEQVCSGRTGYAEIVIIEFDPSIISYSTLLEVFFTVHDPTQLNRQGNDIGTQYRSCIMPTNEEQERVAKESIQSFKDAFTDPIVTTIEPALNLVVAEVYHHDYYARNPTQGYCQMVVGPKISKVRRKLSHLYEKTE
tara:strand:+ start:1428 stop:1958 length:531 start_codon:yes stop_codon:yes gene_type:complete